MVDFATEHAIGGGEGDLRGFFSVVSPSAIDDQPTRTTNNVVYLFSYFVTMRGILYSSHGVTEFSLK